MLSRQFSSFTRQTSILTKVLTTWKGNRTPQREERRWSHQRLAGFQILKDAKMNKGLGFTLKERQMLGIHGLQPPHVRTQEEQVAICKMFLAREPDPLNKYLYLMDLCDRNEKVFFKLMTEDIDHLMPVVYTPTVGLACQKYGVVYRRPRGLFISIHDSGHIYDILKNWPEPTVKAVCMTDGQRILGLGDLGAYGMGIPVGKLSLYTVFGGISPEHCLPITLDVGTNNKALLEDPLYIGLRQERVTGKKYDDFIDEYMQAVVKCFGQNTLIQFEDFGNQNAFRLLRKYRDSYCTFNDDIQGTAGVVVSGLLASTRLTGKRISQYKFIFLGAGEAAVGIADLTVKAMVRDGLSTEQAVQNIWMLDIDGLLALDRPEGLPEHNKHYAKKHAPSKDFKAIVEEIKPSVLIGASAAAGAFTPEILQAMASFNERPVIFALSNPTPKAECTAEQAYNNTDGRAIFASGSPFGKVTMGGKTFVPGQGNNAYIFPGLGLGVIVAGVYNITDDFLLISSDTVACNVTEQHLNEGRVYPPLEQIKECSIQIACNIMEYAYEKHMTSNHFRPKDIRKHVISQMYDYNYEPAILPTWKWPEGSRQSKCKKVN